MNVTKPTKPRVRPPKAKPLNEDPRVARLVMAASDARNHIVTGEGDPFTHVDSLYGAIKAVDPTWEPD